MTNLMSARTNDEQATSVPPVPEWAMHGDEIARAVGIVSSQAGCSAAAALVLLQEYAMRAVRGLSEIAVSVIDRELRFD